MTNKFQSDHRISSNRHNRTSIHTYHTSTRPTNYHYHTQYSMTSSLSLQTFVLVSIFLCYTNFSGPQIPCVFAVFVLHIYVSIITLYMSNSQIIWYTKQLNSSVPISCRELHVPRPYLHVASAAASAQGPDLLANPK